MVTNLPLIPRLTPAQVVLHPILTLTLNLHLLVLHLLAQVGQAAPQLLLLLLLHLLLLILLLLAPPPQLVVLLLQTHLALIQPSHLHLHQHLRLVSATTLFPLPQLQLLHPHL